jgi:hypothetical protein
MMEREVNVEHETKTISTTGSSAISNQPVVSYSTAPFHFIGLKCNGLRLPLLAKNRNATPKMCGAHAWSDELYPDGLRGGIAIIEYERPSNKRVQTSSRPDAIRNRIGLSSRWLC